MFGQLEPQEIDSVIGQQLIGRLGCYSDGKIYVVPISYVFDGTYIYSFSREGMKTRMMRKNPEVCLQIDTLGQMDNWQSVIVWATFEELKDKSLRNDALIKLMNRVLPAVTTELVHISPQHPFLPDDPAKIVGVVYRLKIKEKTGRFEKHMAENLFEY